MNLTEYVKRVSLEDFGKEFRHEAVWNPRLVSTGGRFFPKDGHLDFNPHIYQENEVEVFRKIVRHELCHYHLYYENKGYRHRDRDFKELLKAVGGLRYAPKRTIQQSVFNYQCESCGLIYQRKRRMAIANYRCGKCRGRLVLLSARNQSAG